METLGSWFREQPHRATVANIVLLTVLLALIGSNALFALVGGIVICLAFLLYAWRALAATARPGAAGWTYRTALLWVPGIVAAIVAIVAITVVRDGEASTALNSVAFTLFAVEAILLVVSRPGRITEATA